MKPRSINIKLHLDNADKKLLTRYFRQTSACGLREGLRRQAINALFAANDWQSEQEKTLARRNASGITGSPQPGRL